MNEIFEYMCELWPEATQLNEVQSHHPARALIERITNNDILGLYNFRLDEDVLVLMRLVTDGSE